MKKLIILLIFVLFYSFIYILFLISVKFRVNIFELKRDKYTFKIIEERDYRKKGVEVNLFYYISDDFSVGCGELLKINIDEQKKYIYGKLKFKNKQGVGIYKQGKENIEGVELSFLYQNAPFIYSKEYSKIKKLCSNYFFIDIENNKYYYNLSENEFNKIMKNYLISKNLIKTKEFLKKYGKYRYNFDDIEDWMSSRQP